MSRLAKSRTSFLGEAPLLGVFAALFLLLGLGYSLLTTRYPDPSYASGSLVEIEQNSGAAEGLPGRGGRSRAAASLPVDEKSGAIILSP